MSSALSTCLLPAFVVGALCGATFAPALAGESVRNGREKADRLCESYGAGFVSGDAPGHCVKVEERLRVDPNGRRGMSGWESPTAFAPIEDGPLRAHVRITGGFGAAGGLPVPR